MKISESPVSGLPCRNNPAWTRIGTSDLRNDGGIRLKNAGDSLAEWTATGLGAGHLPVAPGTWGSLEGVVLAAAIHWTIPIWERGIIAGLAILFSVVGVWAASRSAALSGDSDPSKVVIDEIAGQLLCLVWIPVTGVSLLAGFLLFRCFDIVKPAPARQSESLPGGWGIMADDWIAGLYAGGVLALLHFVLGWI